MEANKIPCEKDGGEEWLNGERGEELGCFFELVGILCGSHKHQ